MTPKLLAGCALALTLAAASATPAADERDVFDTAVALKEHTIFLVALQEAGLTDALRGKGPVTVFAPTDAAFKKLGDETIRALVRDKERLKALAAAHLVRGKQLFAKDLAALAGKAVNGLPVSTKGGLTIGGAKVTKPDLACSNGVIHVIDAVLIPAK